MGPGVDGRNVGSRGHHVRAHAVDLRLHPELGEGELHDALNLHQHAARESGHCLGKEFREIAVSYIYLFYVQFDLRCFLLFLSVCLSAPVFSGEYDIGVEDIEYYPIYAKRDGIYAGYARELMDEFAKKEGHKHYQ